VLGHVVDGEAVGHVAACAVDEQGDRLGVLVRQLAQPLDAGARRVLLDVADQVHVADTIACLLAQLRPDGVHELDDQAFAQLSHSKDYRIGPSSANGGDEIKGEREDEVHAQ
jgi:hypothetical protein